MNDDMDHAEIKALLAAIGRDEDRASALPDVWKNLVAREKNRIHCMSLTRLEVSNISRRILTVEMGPPLPEDVVGGNGGRKIVHGATVPARGGLDNQAPSADARVKREAGCVVGYHVTEFKPGMTS